MTLVMPEISREGMLMNCRKHVVYISLAATVILCAACRKSEPLNPGSALEEMTLELGQTKTVLDGKTVLWQGSDRIGVSNLSSNHAFANDNPDETLACTSFSGSAETGVDLYAYYPFTDDAVSSGNLTLVMAQVQHPSAGTFDPSADILVSRPFAWEGSPVAVEFARLGAVIKLTINDKTGGMLEGEKLHEVSLVAENNLTGTVSIPMKEPSKATLSKGSRQLMARYDEPVDISSGAYMTAFPTTLSAGGKLTFEAVTDNYKISREITVPSGGIDLKSAVLTPVSVSVSESDISCVQSIRIDFGQCSSKGSTPADWNKVTAYELTSSDTPISLYYENGSSSGMTISSLTGFNAEWAGSTGENQSWVVEYPEYSLTTAVWCDGLRITGTKNQGDKGPAKVVLAGFSADKYYSFDLMAFRFNGSKAARQCRYTIEGAGRSETKTIYPGMTSSWSSKGDVEEYRVRYQNIVPAADGSITIEVTAVDTGAAVDGLLNAVVIREYDSLIHEDEPEPSEKEVTVTPEPEREKLLRNPFSGWAIYAGLGSGLADNFWDTYDNFPSSRGTIKVSDYASLLLIRMKWSEIEPSEGVYAWDPACTAASAKRYKMLVEGARARGLKVVPSFRIDSRDLDVWAVPEYVKNKGAQGFTSGSKNVWTPYPDDPIFQECFKKMLKALATQLDDPQTGGHIQGLGIGEWGEYHSCKYSTGDESPREAVLNWMCDTFMEVFQNIPVVINYHRMIGTGRKEGTPDSQSASLLDGACRKGLCFGSGAFGMHQYYSTWEKNFIAGYKYKVPVTMEGGWVRSSHSLSAIQNDGYESWPDVRRGEFDDAAGAYANVMDLRYNKNPESSECWSWFNDAFDLVDKFIQEGIYRIYPTSITCPTTLSDGESFRISSSWTNLGWSYCPTNVVQYKKRYRVAYALLDQSGKPVKVFYHAAADPSKWYKSQTTSYTFDAALSGVSAGRYTWAVAIVDILNNDTPGIQLAVKDSYKTSDGWVKLANVNIR